MTFPVNDVTPTVQRDQGRQFRMDLRAVKSFGIVLDEDLPVGHGLADRPGTEPEPTQF